MNIELNNTNYSDEEILEIAEKIHEEYEGIFTKNEVPVGEILKLARLLSASEDEDENKRVMALEYAARIKYEVQLYTDYTNYNVRKDPRYFPYKNNEFAADKALHDIYKINEEKKEDIPKLIKYCIGNAYCSVYGEYLGENKKLTLDNK